MLPSSIDEHPVQYLDRVGEIFATFDISTQDSGNVSYGVTVGRHTYFVKTAGDPANTEPVLDFEGRVALLRNAARLAEDVRHDLLPAFHGITESPVGPLLVYEWRTGEHLGTDRTDPASAHQRFKRLAPAEITEALDRLYDLHAQLDAMGWVEGDFYDGALLYDFAERRLTVVDLDSYEPSPYRNTIGRMFGASRLMAPEQFSLGAPIDTRSTAFVMARTALTFLSDGTLEREPFRGTDAQYAVLQEATTTRFPDYRTFHAAWLDAT
ncbi:serine/threonine protein kinase [Kribbella sancticallisti]|uniref:Serine/threonine protein kinase n=1 Tax=Kribbella sancticallisti TaxID=460087 RepID=A0ABN2CA65_9ACTN